MQKSKQLFINVVMTLFFIMVLFLFPTGLLAAITIHTTDFIPDGSRTNFVSFNSLSDYTTSSYIEDGVKIEQINGYVNNIISFWGFPGSDGKTWYPAGGDHGYTKITLVSGGDFGAIGFMVDSGWYPNPVFLQYALLNNGNIVAQGELPIPASAQYLGFSGGGFDAVLLSASQSSGNTVFDDHYNALAIDSIEILASCPDPFTFIDQTGVSLHKTITSNTITLTGGTNPPWPISIDNGKYSINGGPYTSDDGTVNNNDTVTVQLTSSENYFTITDATLTIGGISDTFSLTTLFKFNTKRDVPLNTKITSNTITSGINAAVPISITGGEYSINDGPYTSADGTVNKGDTVTVQVTSSENYFTMKSAKVNIGEESDNFSTVTQSAPSVSGGDDKSWCFIATAAFGSPMAGQVEILRQFRDRYLLKNALGQKFVAWYYRNGPVAANFIKDKPLVKAAVRVALYPLIGFSYLLISGYLPFVTVGLLLSTLLFLRFRPKKLIAK
jgi:hypothetical protein